MLALAVAVLGAAAQIDVVAAAVGLDRTQVAPLGGRARRCRSLRTGCSAGLDLAAPEAGGARPAPQRPQGLVAVGAARAMAAAGDPPDQVASLLIGAPVVGEPWAAAALAAAATEAERRGAPEVAKDLWLRQLDEPLDTFSRGWATASVAWRSCTWGIRPVQLALDDLAPLVDDPGLRSRVRFAAARAFSWNAEADRSAACFGAAAADARIAGEEEVARRSEAGALLASGIGGLGDDRVALLAGALPASDGTAASSSQVCGRALASLVAHDDADEVRALARGGLADERLYVLPTSDFTAITAAAFCLSTTGATSEAIEALDRVIGAAHQVGQLSTVATVSASRASALLAAGRVSEAADSAELALGAAHAWPIERPSAAAALAEVHRLHGDLDRAIRTLAEHPARSDGGPLRTAGRWLVVAARVAIDRREPIEGERSPNASARRGRAGRCPRYRPRPGSGAGRRWRRRGGRRGARPGRWWPIVAVGCRARLRRGPGRSDCRRPRPSRCSGGSRCCVPAPRRSSWSTGSSPWATSSSGSRSALRPETHSEKRSDSPTPWAPRARRRLRSTGFGWPVAVAAPRTRRRGLAHARGGADLPAGGRGDVEPRGGRRIVRVPQDGRVPPGQRLREARDHPPGSAGRRTRRRPAGAGPALAPLQDPEPGRRSPPAAWIRSARSPTPGSR